MSARPLHWRPPRSGAHPPPPPEGGAAGSPLPRSPLAAAAAAPAPVLGAAGEDAGPDEGALARAAARGDRLSFRALYELAAPSAVRLAERIVRRRDLAEEICQEAFCQAWARIAGFRGDARFRTWLLTIVRNAALDALRRERTRERFKDAERAQQAAAPPGAGPEPGERLAVGELAAALAAALGELPEETRTAFTLAAIEKLPYAEVGAVLGITIDGVKCRVYRAREHLRARLAAFREP